MGATITYNGSVIAELNGGEAKKLKTAGTYLEGDLTVEAAEVIDSPLPIEFSTEEEAAAIIESGEIGGVYKYTGTTTENYENGELYVLEGETEADALQGTWVFNETVQFTLSSNTTVELIFYSGELGLARFSIMRIASASATGSNKLIYSRGGTAFEPVYTVEGWANDEYRYITIHSTLDDIGISSSTVDEFLSWLQSNATKQSSVQLVKLINQTDLEELTVTENGDYTASVGYSKVTVNVEGSGGDSALPIEVSTEAEMTALLESGEVGGVYKYVGETGTYENGALYLLEADADALKGTWVFNDALIKPSGDVFIATMNYSFTGGVGEVFRQQMSVLFYNSETVYEFDTETWRNEDYKIITISTLYSDLVVEAISKEEFFAWLQANATKQ